MTSRAAHEEWTKLLDRHWSPVWGDRRQEMVFIGIGMDEAALRADLDACLVGSSPTQKFDAEDFRNLPNPFPAWRREAA
ncbi:MAG TPA: GTP-binding protein [Saliniramus sp.]|nr:GTP-binding protein [Saliniramus sp.]